VANAFGLDPPVADVPLDQFLANHGGTIAMVITVAFLLHVLVVRLFRLTYVYLTGHLMFWMSVVITAALITAWGELGQWTLVLVGSVILAAYWTLQPMYMASKMKQVIGSDEWGYGHTSSSVCWLAATVAPKVGNHATDDSEKVKLPKRLSFFKDVNVSTALVIATIMLVAMLFADAAVRNEQAAAYDPDVNPWIWALIQSLKFAAGIAILLFGVRMFLAEMVPAFKGISDRVIPGARPALDCPTVFPFAPTAVMLGFLGATAVFLVLMVVFAAIDWAVIVPPMIMLFFPGGAAGVFGNRFGGWKGAVVGGGLNGAFLAVGQAVTWPLLAGTGPEIATLADPDWYIITWAILFVQSPFAFGFFEEAFVTVFGWLMVAGIIAGIAYWFTSRGRRPTKPARPQEPAGPTADPTAVSS
jgi:PTS system ascorbate-specific IIC component